jgi:hypothetical protein
MKKFFQKLVDNLFGNPRADALLQLAEEHNWSFSQILYREAEPVMNQGFRLLRYGKTIKLRNGLTIPGNYSPGKIRIVDCIRQTDKARIRTTILIYQSDQLDLFPFFIRPRNFFHAVGSVFVKPVPLLEGIWNFNKQYVVKTKDRKTTSLDLNEEMLEIIGEEPGWRIEGSRDFVIAYRYGKLLPPPAYEFQIDRFDRMCERLLNGLSSAEYV